MKGPKFAVLAIAVVAAAGCVNRAAQEQGKRTMQLLENPVKPVITAAVKTQNLTDSVEVTGGVTTSSDVTVGAKVVGRVNAVYVRDGDEVHAGQVIAVQDTTNQMLTVQQADSGVQSARSALNQAIANATLQPSRSTAAVDQAKAQLRSAQAQLKKAREGARPEEKAQAQAQVNSTRSAMDNAKKDLTRKQELVAAGAISQSQVDAAQTAYDAAYAQYQQALENQKMQLNWTRPEDITTAEEAVRQAQEAVKSAQTNKQLDVLLTDQVQSAKAALASAQSQARLARQGLADAQVRAPFDGKISGTPVQPGTFLSPGGAVARIIGKQGTYFEGEVPSDVLAQIHTGSPVKVSIDTLGDTTLNGTVAAISPSASNVGRLFKVRIQLLGGTDLVKPGMFARGEVTVRNIKDATVVPTNSIVKRQGQDVIFIVNGDKAKRVNVQVGLRTDGVSQVTGTVQPGDKVVIDGQSDLEDGSKVSPDKAATTASTGPGSKGGQG